MANFIISPYAISWDSIRNQLQSYIQGKTEQETWKDFYVSGAGQTVIEIAAALGAFYAYHFIVGRRECYLTTAQNYTSIVGLAQNNGYSCKRGTNLQVNINFAPSVSTPLYKWDIIGSYLDYDLIVMDNFDGENELTPGKEYTIPCVIGNLVDGNDAIIIPTDKLTSFSFHSDKTTDQYRLILNNQEVPTSTQVKDLQKDYWVTITNPYGSFDAFYLQQGNYKYSPNDILYVQFVERNNLDWGAFSESNLHIDIPGQITEAGCTLLQDRIESEDIDQIRIKAPLYHETSMVIRSRRDYSKYLLLANNKLITANDRDITPGLIEITYLTKDGSILTQEEINHWLDEIEQARPSGVARALITHPIEVARDLKIKIWKTETGSTSAISSSISDIIKKYNNVLGLQLDLNQLEHDIERLEGVKIARVTAESGTWKANDHYKIFDTITNKNGDTYWVSAINMKSGTSKPTWPKDIGQTVVDNQLVWEKVSEYDGTVLHTWKANSKYEKYDYIREEVLSDGTYGQSGINMPVWGSNNLRDNHLEWTKLNDSEVEKLRQDYYESISSEIANIRKQVTTEVAARLKTEFDVDFETNYVDELEAIKIKYQDSEGNIPSQNMNAYNKEVQSLYENELQKYLNENLDRLVQEELDETLDNMFKSSKFKQWYASTAFLLNDLIMVSQEEKLYFYKCTKCYLYVDSNIFRVSEYVGKSSNQEPVWSSTTYDGNLVWKKYENGIVIQNPLKWEPETNFKVGDNIEVNEQYYTVTNLIGTSSKTEPKWPTYSGAEIEDNDIIWTMMDESSRTLTLAWNEYFSLTWSV